MQKSLTDFFVPGIPCSPPEFHFWLENVGNLPKQTRRVFIGNQASTLLGIFERSHMLVSAPVQAAGFVKSDITEAQLELAEGLQGPQHL